MTIAKITQFLCLTILPLSHILWAEWLVSDCKTNIKKIFLLLYYILYLLYILRSFFVQRNFIMLAFLFFFAFKVRYLNNPFKVLRHLTSCTGPNLKFERSYVQEFFCARHLTTFATWYGVRLGLVNLVTNADIVTNNGNLFLKSQLKGFQTHKYLRIFFCVPNKRSSVQRVKEAASSKY